MTGHPSFPAALAVAEAGSGRPVLFQHGLCGDAAQPQGVFPRDGFRCLTVECRGHGRSPAGDPSAFGIATFTSDIAEVIERLGVAPLPVGGISMGAAIALRLAVTRPDLVSALVLARPAWVTASAPDTMRPNAEVGDLIARHGPEQGRRLFEQSETAARLAVEAPDNLASLRSFFARTPHDVTAELLGRISRDGPGVTDEEVGALRVPTLVIGHDRDVIHPLDKALTLAALIPAARMATIPAKAVDREAYESAFRASLETFLAELPA